MFGNRMQEVTNHHECGLVDCPPFGQMRECFAGYLCQLATIMRKCRTNQLNLSVYLLTTWTAEGMTAFVDHNYPTLPCPTQFDQCFCENLLDQIRRLRILETDLSSLYIIHANVSLASAAHREEPRPFSFQAVLQNFVSLSLLLESRRSELESSLFKALFTSVVDAHELIRSTISRISQLQANFSIKPVSLAFKSFHRLRIGQWLDDEIVNYFVRKWCCRDRDTSVFKTIGLSSFFATKVLFKDAICKVVCAAEKKLKRADWDCVFFPINESNTHWYSVCINYRHQRIDIYDSLRINCVPNRQKPVELRKNTGLMLSLMRLTEVFAKLRGFHVNLKNNLNTDWEKREYVFQVPFQPNNSDCGIYTLWHLKHILKFGNVQVECRSTGLELTGDMMAENRLRLALEILEDCDI
ncbi:hypothetical protein D9757_015294 [Collybiopsis confluens]|uniref:Ubiquitin-like protease family profile domain-containing protein n=1 Tax=Collybiopsis confluens TaxID=2823264 RepID=A0A8H5CGR6_9AGAR|nr:hypothetical protein D9757_015294 [Collybiopsis confluens]